MKEAFKHSWFFRSSQIKSSSTFQALNLPRHVANLIRDSTMRSILFGLFLVYKKYSKAAEIVQ